MTRYDYTGRRRNGPAQQQGTRQRAGPALHSPAQRTAWRTAAGPGWPREIPGEPVLRPKLGAPRVAMCLCSPRSGR